MPAFNFSITINPPIKEITPRFRKSYKKDFSKRLHDTAKRVHRTIVHEAPKRTGALRRAIKLKRVNETSFTVQVDQRAKAAKYEPLVRLGVRPERINPILPKRKKALYWPGARHPVKAVYHHPGIKANPYFERGMRKSDHYIRQLEKDITQDVERMYLS